MGSSTLDPSLYHSSCAAPPPHQLWLLAESLPLSQGTREGGDPAQWEACALPTPSPTTVNGALVNSCPKHGGNPVSHVAVGRGGQGLRMRSSLADLNLGYRGHRAQASPH